VAHRRPFTALGRVRLEDLYLLVRHHLDGAAQARIWHLARRLDQHAEIKSVSQEDWQRRIGQHVAGCSLKDQLPQAVVCCMNVVTLAPC
jgi:hypothetical protein